MGTQGVTGAIARQDWLRPVEDTLRQLLHQAYESAGPNGRKISNALHGTWLGHPLHPVLTDIPIGSWTAAMVFDVIDTIGRRRGFGVAADAAVAVGIAGALGAVVTGLTDWQDTDPPARRIGLTHGLLNLTGVALFTSSLVQRRRGNRATGRGLSALGYAVATLAARLGGNMVYDQRVGVDHTAGQTFPQDFVPVLAETDLPEGALRRIVHNDVPILLAKRNNRIFALAETCPHMGGPLSEGRMIDDSVKCPWHGSRFAFEDGRVLDGPATHPLPCLDVRVRNGQIEVRKAAGQPMALAAR